MAFGVAAADPLAGLLHHSVVEGLLDPQVPADVTHARERGLELRVEEVVPLAPCGSGRLKGVGGFIAHVGADASAYDIPPLLLLEVGRGSPGRAEQGDGAEEHKVGDRRVDGGSAHPARRGQGTDSGVEIGVVQKVFEPLADRQWRRLRPVRWQGVGGGTERVVGDRAHDVVGRLLGRLAPSALLGSGHLASPRRGVFHCRSAKPAATSREDSPRRRATSESCPVSFRIWRAT